MCRGTQGLLGFPFCYNSFQLVSRDLATKWQKKWRQIKFPNSEFYLIEFKSPTHWVSSPGPIPAWQEFGILHTCAAIICLYVSIATVSLEDSRIYTSCNDSSDFRKFSRILKLCVHLSISLDFAMELRFCHFSYPLWLNRGKKVIYQTFVCHNPYNANATFVQSTRLQRFCKWPNPYYVGIHWIALAEFSLMNTNMPGFQSSLKVFASFCIGQISHQPYKG